MDTSIQVSRELLETLRKRKISDKESYESIIWDLIEDTMELSEETKRDIAIARKEYKEGKFKTLEEIKRESNI